MRASWLVLAIYLAAVAAILVYGIAYAARPAPLQGDPVEVTGLIGNTTPSSPPPYRGAPAASATMPSTGIPFHEIQTGSTVPLSTGLSSSAALLHPAEYPGPAVSSSLHVSSVALAGLPHIYSCTVEVYPGRYVDGDTLGAGRWYLFRIRISYGLGVRRVTGVRVSMNAGGLWMNATCSSGGCSGSGSLPVHGMGMHNVSPSTIVVEVNASLPWSVSGPLRIHTYTDTRDGLTLYTLHGYRVVNETSVASYTVTPREAPRHGLIRVEATIRYRGTSIPAAGERVEAYITGPHRLQNPAAVTDPSGVAVVQIRAPGAPGTYTLVIDPEHGDPATIEIRVTEAYGGKPYPGNEPPAAVTAALILVALAVAIVLRTMRPGRR